MCGSRPFGTRGPTSPSGMWSTSRRKGSSAASSFPRERIVLGGAGTRAFVLERDVFDVEVLRVYEVVR